MIDLRVNLDIAAVGWKKAFPKMRAKILQTAACAFLNAKKPAVFENRIFEINVLLTTDANVRKLNRLYRGKDMPTNVLSFPQFDLHNRRRRVDLGFFPDNRAIPLGDIVLARGTIVRESREQKKSLENHTLHLVVHGALHLMGYDHMTEREAKFMEKLECDILAVLGYPDPYHEHDVKQKGRGRNG